MASQVKICSKCTKKKPIGSFYVNKLNKSQNCRDLWCKDCISDYVNDKESLIYYCEQNRRAFSETLWSDCFEKVTVKFSDDLEFNSLSKEKRLEFSTQKVINGYFSRQSQVQYYSYVINKEDVEDDGIETGETDNTQTVKLTRNDEKKYSLKWGGEFTSDELIYLENQYKKAQDQYDLKTENDLEYAQNVAVAGLIVRKTRNEYLNNENGADKRWREAVNTYDALCTSAKLNQKTRTENSNNGLGSFGETWKCLEEMGFEPISVTFPPDTVDVILQEYSHSHVALRGALDDV